MSIKTDELIDAVLAAGCEFVVAENISDRDEIKKIFQQYDAMWIVLPKRFPWHFYKDQAARSAISIEKIGGCKNRDEWRICGMYSDVLTYEDFTLELNTDYDKLVSSSNDNRIPKNGI